MRFDYGKNNRKVNGHLFFALRAVYLVQVLQKRAV